MRLNIEKLVYGGEGLARLPADEHGPGKAVFVPFVLPGESVEAALREEKPGFARAQLKEFSHASARRIAPRCPYFQRCGGCHYQHTDYEHQLEIKAAILKENLRRIAKLELDTELQHPSFAAVELSQPLSIQSSDRAGIRNWILQVQLPRTAAGGRVPDQLAFDQPRADCGVAVGARGQSSGRRFRK